MKPFSIGAAKSGAKVITRDGRPVRIVDFSIRRGLYKILAVIPSNDTNEEGIYLFPASGKFLPDELSENDLFIEEGSTYRPYANVAEMDEAINQHGMFVINRLTDVRQAIIAYSNLEVATSATKQSYKAFLISYTWLDGTPCGVKEGGDDEFLISYTGLDGTPCGVQEGGDDE